MLAQADGAILDLGLPDGSGADLIPELRAAHPKAQAVVLSTTYEPILPSRAIEPGAVAILSKLTHLGQVAQAVRRILAGERLQPTGKSVD